MIKISITLLIVGLIILFFYLAILKNKNEENISNVIQKANEDEIEKEIQQILKPRYEKIVEPIHPPTKSDTKTITTIKSNTIYTYVAGTTYGNSQANIRKVLKEEAYFLDKYDGLKGKDLKEDLEYDRVWEYEPFEIELYLVPEPNNKYDSNAIAIYGDINESLKIGYVPKQDNKNIINIINQHSLTIIGLVKGGKYKELSWDDKISTKSTNYSIELIIKYY